MFSRRTLIKAGLAGSLVHIAGAHGQSTASLRALAASKGIRFGAAIDGRTLEVPEAVRIFVAQCGSVTPRNALKWPTIEASPGAGNWVEMDAIVNFAQQHNMACYGHTLIWYNAPSWVKSMTTREPLIAAMQSRIQTTMQRYPSQIDIWDVVNEPLEYDKAAFRDSVFYRVLGEDYIAEAFRMAHAARPDAKLVLNETHLEKAGPVYSAKRRMILDVVRRLRERGIPIHGVGLQGHFRPGLDKLDAAEVEQFCATLGQMGLGVYITELDGSCRFSNKVDQYGDRIYDEAFGTFVSVVGRTGTLRGLTLWNMLEGEGDKQSKPRAGCETFIGLYDPQLQPRRMLDVLTQALQGLPNA
jgi:endo-1,4-beta-xylanase